MFTKAISGLPNLCVFRLATRCISTNRLHLARNICRLPRALPLHTTVWHSQSTRYVSATVPRQQQEHQAIKTVSSNNDRHMLEVKWTDGCQTSYPYVFLRDNCLCSQCYDTSSFGRLLLMKDFDVNCKPSTVELTQSRDGVAVTWHDGHQSTYPLEWIAERNFPAEQAHIKQQNVTPKLWGAELHNHIPVFDYHKLMTDDYVLYKWLYKLQELGFVLINGTPLKLEQLKEIGKRVGYLKRNTYGEVFTVKAKINPSNVAYTTATLGCHTDLPYFSHTPGIQMLHCLEQAEVEGGDNIIMDGFYAAKLLKEKDPEAYSLLSTMKVDFEDIGEDSIKYHMLDSKPIIWLDQDDKMCKVTYNNMQRASKQNIPLDKVEPLYRAMKLFEDIINNPENHVLHKLKPGEVVCVNNWRVMHGRVGFKITGSSGRHLEGGYIDWDELLSRFRVLAKELNVDMTKYPE